MSPFRWDVVLCGFVLAVPVLMLGLRGDLDANEVATRLLWCLGAGWVAVAVIRFASVPPHRPEVQGGRSGDRRSPSSDPEPTEPAADGEPALP